jgi:hypothetical protein
LGVGKELQNNDSSELLMDACPGGFFNGVVVILYK